MAGKACPKTPCHGLNCVPPIHRLKPTPWDLRTGMHLEVVSKEVVRVKGDH